MVCKSIVGLVLFCTAGINSFSCLGMIEGAGRGKLVLPWMGGLVEKETQLQGGVVAEQSLSIENDDEYLGGEGVQDQGSAVLQTVDLAADNDDDEYIESDEEDVLKKVKPKKWRQTQRLLPSQAMIKEKFGVAFGSLEEYITWLLCNHATLGFSLAMSSRKIAAAWYGSALRNSRHGHVAEVMNRICSALGMSLPKPHSAHLSFDAKKELIAALTAYLNYLVVNKQPLKVECHSFAKGWQASNGETAGHTTVSLTVLRIAETMKIKLICPRPPKKRR